MFSGGGWTVPLVAAEQVARAKGPRRNWGWCMGSKRRNYVLSSLNDGLGMGTKVKPVGQKLNQNTSPNSNPGAFVLV